MPITSGMYRGVSQSSCGMSRGVSGSSQPATCKPRAPQTHYEIGTTPHQSPDQPRTIVLDHQNDWSLIEREVVFRHPARTSGTAARKRRIEAADETVFVFHIRVRPGTVLQCGKHDLRSERQRRGHGPGRQRAIIGTIRHTSRDISKKASCDSPYAARRRPRAVTGCDAPRVLAIGAKVLRISNRVLLVHVGCAAAVLVVVNCLSANERILEAAYVIPHVREVMHEQ